MIHYMKLNNDPFNWIKSGNKSIEIRLYDEKRKLVNENDYIEFTNLKNNEVLKVKVLKLHRFNTFKELFDNFDNRLFGFEDNVDYSIMYDYYSKEEENKYGVLGIEFKLIEGDEL